MDLDRGTLARIDRRAFSGLDRDERYRMVRLAVSDAVWSTWRRYCEALGVSMGRGIVGLIANELRTVVDEDLDGEAVFGAVFVTSLTRNQIVVVATEDQIRPGSTGKAIRSCPHRDRSDRRHRHRRGHPDTG